MPSFQTIWGLTLIAQKVFWLTCVYANPAEICLSPALNVPAVFPSCIARHSQIRCARAMSCGCFGDADEAWADAPVVLTVGLQNAGKSLLLQRLSDLSKPPGAFKAGNPASIVPADAVSTMPTIGTELVKLQASKGKLAKNLVIREVGGLMQPIWHHYYTEAAAVLFVVDAAAASSLAEAAMALFSVLQNPQLEGKPICITLNKLDSPNVLSRSQLDTVLRIHDLQLQYQELHVQAVSALEGDALLDLLQWIDAAAGAGHLGTQRQKTMQKQQAKHGLMGSHASSPALL